MTNTNEQFEVNEEMEFTGAPSQEEAAVEAKDDRVWTNDAGEEVSKSEFIRIQFTENNLSRKEISEQFDINYRTVYGATVNMVNDAEPATRGRAAANHKINIDGEGNVITVVEGVTHINGEASELTDVETMEVDRNEFIKEQVAAGKSRGDVAKALGLSYGVVYGLTKEVAGASQRHEVEYNGETVSRSEAIRRMFADGISKADIAKELGVDYPVVWSALKSLKSEQEKFQDAVDRLAKFGEFTVDAEAFAAALEGLKDFEFKTEEAEEEVAADASVYAE